MKVAFVSLMIVGLIAIIAFVSSQEWIPYGLSTFINSIFGFIYGYAISKILRKGIKGWEER